MPVPPKPKPHRRKPASLVDDIHHNIVRLRQDLAGFDPVSIPEYEVPIIRDLHAVMLHQLLQMLQEKRSSELYLEHGRSLQLYQWVLLARKCDCYNAAFVATWPWYPDTSRYGEQPLVGNLLIHISALQLDMWNATLPLVDCVEAEEEAAGKDGESKDIDKDVSKQDRAASDVNAKLTIGEIMYDCVSATVHGACCPVNSRTSCGMTALHVAAGRCNYKLAERLLRDGADVNAIDSSRQTPLHRIIANGKKFCPLTLKVLMGAKADVNAQDSSGDTPLHVASKAGFGRVVRELMVFELMDPTIRNIGGFTPQQVEGQLHYGNSTSSELQLARSLNDMLLNRLWPARQQARMNDVSRTTRLPTVLMHIVEMYCGARKERRRIPLVDTLDGEETTDDDMPDLEHVADNAPTDV